MSKLKTFSIITFILFGFCSLAKRPMGQSTGNGGEVENRILRDLNGNSSCKWVTSETLISPFENSLIEILDKIKMASIDEETNAVDIKIYQFAVKLESVIRNRIRWCLTSNDLKRVYTEDEQSVITEYKIKRKLAAIRVLNNVFINTKAFKSLTNEMKSYLILHEAMHSEILREVPGIGHNSQVRSIIRNIYLLVNNKTHIRDFRLSLKVNSADIEDFVCYSWCKKRELIKYFSFEQLYPRNSSREMIDWGYAYNDFSHFEFEKVLEIAKNYHKTRDFSKLIEAGFPLEILSKLKLNIEDNYLLASSFFDSGIEKLVKVGIPFYVVCRYLEINNKVESCFGEKEKYSKAFKLLEKHGISLSEMIELKTPLSDLMLYGYSLKRLKRAGFTIDELKKTRVPYLNSNGEDWFRPQYYYRAKISDFVKNGFKLKELSKVFSIEDFKYSDVKVTEYVKWYKPYQLYNAKISVYIVYKFFTAKDLKQGGYKFSDLVGCYSGKELKEAGFNFRDYKKWSESVTRWYARNVRRGLRKDGFFK